MGVWVRTPATDKEPASVKGAGVPVQQLPQRDQGDTMQPKHKAMSEIGPTTYGESGVVYPTEGLPMAGEDQPQPEPSGNAAPDAPASADENAAGKKAAKTSKKK
jgi:hypothetical protein